ncbi:MAG: CoA-binding protein [Candidatus Lokiarchaeota archaeon]|nr:CoA-binding protein [Candidatus Lokiarchaeota archaeon]
MDSDTYRTLDTLFNPRNIAIYKASNKLDYFLMGLREHKFRTDKLYLVNPEVEEVFGQKTIKSLEEIPEDYIDLLILAVGRDKIIETIKTLLHQKQIKTIHIFTAGMGESDNVGKELEKEMMKILHNNKHSIRAIGPNCMGVYSPKGHISYEPFLPTEPGNISFVFQSGDLHSQTIRIGARRYNLRFSKGASVGNCVDLQVSEFLKYFNDDIDTDIIGVYFEGFSKLHPNEGKKLLESLKSMKKPVLFMNGGNTERAQTAVLTHTGSIGSNKKIWDAIIKQTSIINVPTSMDDMIDYLYLFNNHINRFKKIGKKLEEVKYPTGNNVLLILWSGGFGIIDTNILTELGLNVPYFEGERLEKLREIYPIKIGSLNNPIDIPWISSSATYLEVAKTAISENIDVVMIETDTFGDDFNEEYQSNYYKNLLKVKEYTESLGKTFMLILPQYPGRNRENYLNKLFKDGFIVYPSVRRAGKSFMALYEYGKKVKTLNK